MTVMKNPELTINISTDDYLSDSQQDSSESPSVVENDGRECRICFESNCSDTNPLIHPCLCTGNSKYIHRECLNKWRFQHPPNSSPRKRCGICHAEYRITTPKNPCDYSIIRYLHFIITHTISSTFLSMLTCSLLGQLLCRSDTFRSKLDWPYQLQPDANCMVIPDLLLILWHVIVEIRYHQLISNMETHMPIPNRLTRGLVLKNILALPLIYFTPGGVLIIWYIVTFVIYHSYIAPTLSKIDSEFTIVENYPIAD
jgi:hypothetical protein